MHVRISSRVPVFLTIFLTFLSTVGVTQHSLASPERELFDSTNRERRQHGLPALQWNDALAVAAHKHAIVMAHQKSLSHQFRGEPSLPTRANQAGAHFVWLSENVALGSNPSVIHAAFVKSPSHRANILDTDMNVMGVGIVERNGQLFAVEDFSKAK